MTCGLCGHEITEECNAGGYWSSNPPIDVRLCHPDEPSEEHKDCYFLFTVFGERA